MKIKAILILFIMTCSCTKEVVKPESCRLRERIAPDREIKVKQVVPKRG